MRRIAILFFLFSDFILPVSGQEILKDTSFSIVDSAITIPLSMNGFLDGENTLTRDPFTKVFEPMVSVKMTNTGTTTVSKPRLVFNNRGRWFTIDQMRNECFAGAVSEKEKALALWKFFRNNRIHKQAPEGTDNVNDPIKLLGVYGYGFCYNTNYSMCFLARPYNIIAYKGYSPQGLHYVSELNFGSGYLHIDSDIETFYLKNDNTTLSGSQAVFSDRHLIRRTQHYGKQYHFNKQTNNYVANLFFKNDPSFFFGYISESNFHSLDFSLRPGESIIYDWTLPVKAFSSKFLSGQAKAMNQPDSPFSLMNKDYSFSDFHLQNKGGNSLLSSQNTVSVNGLFEFGLNFVNTPTSEILDSQSNIAIRDSGESGPNLHLENIAQQGEMIIKITSPFVIVDGYFSGNFVRYSALDSIQICWSPDATSWSLAAAISGIGNTVDSFSLTSFIDSSSTALYQYYLKFNLSSIDSAKSCGIDSLNIQSLFQSNKFFLPGLLLGTNTIEYSDANTEGRNIDLEIKWKESTINSPPEKILFPLFPPDSAVVNNLKFNFAWPVPGDQDSDDIVNYEFQLSDRADMKYPLSPTFDVYTNEQDSNNADPSFSIPESGLLNDSTTYYWRVRGKDSNGAWGNWSPVWSFTPKGVMPPVFPSLTLNNDTIYLSWQQNTGEPPAYYEIHGSNEWLGFSPDSSTLLDTTSQINFTYPLNGNNKLFYRIIGVGFNGEKSGASEQMELNYPICLNKPDSVFPDSVFSFDIRPAVFNYTRVNPLIYQIETHQDSVSTTVLSKPSWVSINSPETLAGMADSTTAYNLMMDSASGKISILYSSSLTGKSDTSTIFLHSSYVNSVPVINNGISIAVANEFVQDTIFISDSDIPYGDSLIIDILNKPVWLNANMYQNQIVLTGTAAPSDTGVTIINISAVDKSGEAVFANHSLHVIPRGVFFAFSSISCNPQVSFSDSTATINGDSIVLWNWDFGDDGISNLKNPVHYFDSTSTYIVTLHVVSAFGYEASYTDSVLVSLPPQASFSSPGGICSPLVSFTDSSIAAKGDTIVSWNWDFGNGYFSTNQNPDFYFDSSGFYNVTLNITSSSGCNNTFNQIIFVSLVPDAAFVSSGGNCFPLVSFIDSSLAAKGDTILSWSWNFSNGDSSALQNPDFYFDSSGFYNVSLNITSSSGCNNIFSKTISVSLAPQVSFISNGGYCSPFVSFIDSSVAAKGDIIVSWTWILGDASSEIIQNPSHTYQENGIYNIQLYVSTAFGCESSTTDTIIILPIPTANFTFEETCYPDTVCFTDNSSISGGIIASWDWDFGDGNASSLQNPAHHYDSAGIYIVTLSVNSDSGCSSTYSDTLSFSTFSPSETPFRRNNELVVFPNPANGFFSLIISKEMIPGSLEIYNSIGEMVFSDSVDQESKKDISINRFSPGIYHLHIRTSENQWMARIQLIR